MEQKVKTTHYIYAIRDTVAHALIGGLHLYPADPPAVRFFGDVAATPDTVVGKHIADHELICIGMLTVDEHGRTNFFLEDDQGTDDYSRIVITGKAWHAAQQSTLTESSE